MVSNENDAEVLIQIPARLYYRGIYILSKQHRKTTIVDKNY